MVKRKGDKGGNPSPVQTPEFLAKQFKAPDVPEGVELAKTPLSVKLPIAVDAAIRALPNRNEWVRRALSEAAKRDGLLPE